MLVTFVCPIRFYSICCNKMEFVNFKPNFIHYLFCTKKKSCALEIKELYWDEIYVADLAIQWKLIHTRLDIVVCNIQTQFVLLLNLNRKRTKTSSVSTAEQTDQTNQYSDNEIFRRDWMHEFIRWSFDFRKCTACTRCTFNKAYHRDFASWRKLIRARKKNPLNYVLDIFGADAEM